MSIFAKLFGDANKKVVEDIKENIVFRVNELEPAFERFSREELKVKTAEFKKRLIEGETPNDILPEAFAAVREAAKRTLSQRHFDAQIIGGVILHQGKIAEMKTGEGKTLVATLPAYLNALEGEGVHVVSVNDYLSRRDAVWMGQVFHALGLTVGVLNHEASYVYDPTHEVGTDIHDIRRDIVGGYKVIHEFLRPVGRRETYQADITYGTNNEFGFDYLRDNMIYDSKDSAQLGRHAFAIVDEVDSILIDEARTPLIISAPDAESTKLYETFSKIVPRLKENDDYNIDEKLKAATITEKGIEKVERTLNLKNIYEEGGTRYVHHLEQALRAYVLFHRDKDYVVRDGEVIIVDEFTGRLMPGRRWSGGLHQAIEAKEGVLVQKESRTLATITFQNYFRLYKKLSGMTGTAQTSAEEFHKVYNLDVVSVPTNKPMIRADLSDRIYKTENGKFLAVAKEIKKRHELGQPVLIGTVSIAKNELLSAYLNREGVPHKILNAKNHEQEGEIIAQAGRLGAVTVATNMAGRGVDIILGGNPPDHEQAQKVREQGGLHVIGTERHEARRIDDQLRGRSGRQGDPGSSQFFVSAEDELIRIFGGDRLKNIMERLGVGEAEAIENPLISKAIEQAQSKVEGNNFDIRKYILEYDDVINKHRAAIYGLRKEIIAGEGQTIVRDKIIDYIRETINFIVSARTGGEEWNLKEIAESFKAITGFENNLEEKLGVLAEERESRQISDYLFEIASQIYKEKEKTLGTEAFRQLERVLLLRIIDELWVDHLEQVEYLRDSVRLRAYGQRDPLVEYKIEGQKLFNELQQTIGQQVTSLIFKIGLVQQQEANPRQGFSGRVSDKQNVQFNRNQDVGSEKNLSPNRPMPATGAKTPGRNDLCWCGSKKKYKKCHMTQG